MRTSSFAALRAAHLLFLMAALGLVPAPAAAQHPARLEGSVTDPGGAAVPAATVMLYMRVSNSRIGTSTAADGTYRFTSLAPGDYLLAVRADGFAGAGSELVVLASGEHAIRNVRLELESPRTEVIVTASSTPLMIEEIAKAAGFVDREEISLRNEFSVAESLRLVPGFRVQQLQGPGSLTSIHVRGLRSHDTALLVDGVRMRDAADPQGSANPLWEDLLVVAPERIEVLRGSGSSLYGSHAIGGVVNLVTDQGGGAPRAEALAEGGGLGAARGLAKMAGGAWGNRFLYGAGVSHLNVTGGLDGASPHRNTGVQGSAKYFLTPALSATSRLLASAIRKRLSDSPFLAAELEGNLPASGVIPGIPLPDSEVRRIERGEPFHPGNSTYVPSVLDGDSNRVDSFWNLSATVAHQTTPDVSWRATYQFLDTNRRFDDGPAGVRFEPLVGSHSTFDGRIDVVQARADVQAGRFQLISGGYEYEREEYDSRNRDEQTDPGLRTDNRLGIRQHSHSVFAQDQIGLFDRSLQIALSGRMQAFRLSEPRFLGGASPYAGTPAAAPSSAWTGDAAVAYLIRAAGAKLRAHAGNSYRAPALFERYGSTFFFGSFSPFGDPRLSPERALSLDTGVDQWLANSSLKLSGTYFYTRLQETIVFDFSGMIPPGDPYGRFGGYLNVPGGLSRGVELSMEWKPDASTVLHSSYTYSNSDMRTPWDSQGLVRRSMVVSDHMVSLLASRWLGRRFNVTFDLFAISDYLTPLFTSSGTRAFEIPGFARADVTARYVVPVAEGRSFELFGKIENMLAVRPYENGYRAPGVWATAGVRVVF